MWPFNNLKRESERTEMIQQIFRLEKELCDIKMNGYVQPKHPMDKLEEIICRGIPFTYCHVKNGSLTNGTIKISRDTERYSKTWIHGASFLHPAPIEWLYEHAIILYPELF